MLSSYIIEKQLGKGTYGVVYKVKKKEDNKIYVLKQISLLGLSPAQKAEVKLEAQVLSKIKSKYVVKYYDSFEEEGKLNIIMEYCDKGDLNDFIEKQKKTKYLLNEDIIWRIFIKTTLGLADIHKLNILHRDLKSLNIFLKDNDDIRVGDLGVAKILNHTYFAKTFIGTPYYLSPELCEDKPYNDKSDVWALGCILYELCTYQHPFTAKSQGGLILKIINENPKPINTYYSKEMINLLNLIFEKDYKKRPSCLDILKMKYIMDKAKSLGIFDDIKNSFPEIENINENNLKKENDNQVKNNNLIKIVRPVIKKDKKIEEKKRPVSNYGPFARKGLINKKIRFNDIKYDKKKNNIPKVINIEKNENNGNKKWFTPQNIKIVKNNKNIGKNNYPSKKVRKKAIVSPKKKDKDKEIEKNKNILLKESELFEQKRINKIIISPENKIYNNNEQNDNNLIKLENNSNDKPSILDTKFLNNIVNKDIDRSIFNSREDPKSSMNVSNSMFNTKDLNDIYNQEQSIFNEIKNNDNNINININNNIINDTNKEINKYNYSIDSNKDNLINTKKENIEDIINETKKEEEINNNSSIESDIYKTGFREKHKIKNVEEKQNNENKEIKKEIEETQNNTLKSENSINFTEKIKIQDFIKEDESLINMGTKSEFIIVNNDENEGDNYNIENIENIDNNKSMSEDNDESNKNYLSNDDKEEDEDSEEEEKVKEIEITIEKDEKDKNKIKEILNGLESKIEPHKKEILNLIGEEKYKYLMEIVSSGIKDNKQEEVKNKIENFIIENSNDNNKEQIYNIFLLFILECQYYKIQNEL